MNESTETAEVEVVDAVGRSFIRLKTVDDVRAEMARVYRDMRSKRIDMADGTKLIYALSQIGRVVEVVRIERRMDALQQALEKAGIPYVPKQE